jgi:hypothetical protein
MPVGDRGEVVEDLANIHWLELVIGMFLGVPVAYLAGILAHMHAIRFGRFLDNRKLLKKAKTRQQALVVFNRIKAFKENKRDRYPFYLIWASGAVISAILASTVVLVCIELDLSLDKRLLLSYLALMLAVMSVVLVFAIKETARQIERFDDYEKEFIERWGAE